MIILGCRTNDRDPEKKSENLDHGRDHSNYPRTVIIPGGITGVNWINEETSETEVYE